MSRDPHADVHHLDHSVFIRIPVTSLVSAMKTANHSLTVLNVQFISLPHIAQVDRSDYFAGQSFGLHLAQAEVHEFGKLSLQQTPFRPRHDRLGIIASYIGQQNTESRKCTRHLWDQHARNSE